MSSSAIPAPVAVVTGASSGLGAIFAQRLGDRGFHLLLTGRHPGRLDEVRRRVLAGAPDCADPRAVTSYALQRLDVIIAAYQAFLDQIRGRDDVSFALVVGLLAAETHRRADAAAALARPDIP